MRFSRTDRSPLSLWWWSVDRWSLAIVLMLLAAGLVLSLAASPVIARKYDLEGYYFVLRHLMFVLAACGLMFGVSLLEPRQVRRLGWIVLGLSFLGVLLTLFMAAPVKGARRWLDLGPFALQPSEFMKPAFVIAASALLAARARLPGFPGIGLTLLIYGALVLLLVRQPDVGQAVLLTALLALLLFLSGLSWRVVALAAAAAGGGLVIAYRTLPHVAERIDAFVNPAAHDTLQVDRSLSAFMQGDWFGRGPGAGSIKENIPDAHTDFVFAVAAEEFGFVACMGLVALFVVFVLRGLARAFRETDFFTQLAASGLTALIGVQAMVNMGVALQLLPAKGTTLPFLSYGGSSLMALCLSAGLLLALTRRRPGKALAGEVW
ncbi:MAG: FtsW/RodA/SpoVE family cell cycle protein [Alphaproteobacteria bacterium]